MGCGASLSRDVQPIAAAAPAKRPVRVDKGDKVALSPSTNIVFVFGGPGSGKGRILGQVQDTINNVELISTELLILDQLPHKVSNAIKLESTKDVTDLLKKDHSHVTLQWVLSLVEQHIRHHDNTSDHTLFLVDLLPNLQSMVTNSNISQDIPEHLSQFETQLPIAFALYLTLSEDSLHSTTTHPAGVIPPGATVADEADNSRTKQRFRSYQVVVVPFLQYFKDCGRLATIDVSSGDSPSVRTTVNNLLTLDNVSSWKPAIVFAIDGMVVGELDLSTVTMATVITMEPLVINTQSLILRDHLSSLVGVSEYVVIDIQGTRLANQNADQFSKQAVMFQDVMTTEPQQCNSPCQQLNKLARGNCFKSYYCKGISLLFPVATSDHFCEIVSCYISSL
ncbi:uncharacterized protein [Dysidea avara]|uniref:uncharacterized protein isoform X2 n=1 Tax=Dysidea avara TaxID=196820 RepID=UPI003331EB0F